MVVISATSPLPLFPTFKSHHHHAVIKSANQSSLSIHPSSTTHYIHHRIILPRATVNRPISDRVFLLSEATPPENSDKFVASVSDNGDGVSIVISALLSIAFVGLSILTIGVIYIAVTDYLQKREKDKFEKEEAEKAKKGGKKKKPRPKVGPKGFGQKINDYDDDL